MTLKAFAGMDSNELRAALMNNEIVFYDPMKTPRWAGRVWSAGISYVTPDIKYAYADNCVTFTKTGNRRENGVKARENFVIPEDWWYSEGMTPIMGETLETVEKQLTQGQIDAKLKQYAAKRIEELTYYRNGKPGVGLGITSGNVEDYHLDEAFVKIFRELTE